MPGVKPTTTEPPSVGSTLGDGDPQHHRGPDHDPAAEPVEAPGTRFGKLPSWARMPREVFICLAAIVAAGLIILLVLSRQ